MKLDSATLLGLYRSGCFPMGGPDGQIQIYRYDPRTILPIDQFHVPKRMQRELRKETFEIRIDAAFEDVIQGCYMRGRAQTESGWITPEIIQLYLDLHHQGHAHSVEVWKNNRLAGGLYGVCLGAAFCGESMFFLESNASKAAMVGLLQHLKRQDFRLLDCQMATQHTARFGTIDIPLSEYLERLENALALPRTFVSEQMEDRWFLDLNDLST